MIKSFRHKGLQKFFETGDGGGIPAQSAKRIRVHLAYLDAARTVSDINLPGFNLHELKGNRKGTWIKVSDNWRIAFRFSVLDAYDVDLEDYH